MDADFILIRNMKKGNDEAYDVFIRKYYNEILKYYVYHCFDLGHAEDLAQETFIRFFTNLSNYRHVGKAKNFLYTIAGNLCKNYCSKAREAPMDDSNLANLAGTNEFTSNLIIKLEVEDALSRLPDELRDVVVLYYFQSLKLSEIADVLKISLPLVKYRIKQAKIQLKKYLEQEG